MKSSIQSTLNRRPINYTFLGSNLDDVVGAWNLNVTCSTNPPVGSLLVLAYTGQGTTMPTFSDNQGNTPTTRVSRTSGKTLAIVTMPVLASSGSHVATAAFTGSAAGDLAVGCVTGWNPSTFVGPTANSTNTSTTPTAAIGSRDANNALVIAVMSHNGGVGETMGPGAGWTEAAKLNQDNQAAGYPLDLIWQYFSRSGTTDPTWTLGTSTVWYANALVIRGY